MYKDVPDKREFSNNPYAFKIIQFTYVMDKFVDQILVKYMIS